jgi:hypothetical protein
VASIVADIRAAILAQMAITLGATYRVTPYVFEADRNDLRQGKLGYNCRALGASPSEGVNRYFTMDQGFELLFTDSFANDATDDDKQTSIDTMFNKADEVMKAMVNTKVGVGTVLFVSEPTYLDPEILLNAKLVALKVQFVVKYRTAMS